MASLNQRQGPLGNRLAAHLLRRATFHFTPTRILDFSHKTAEEAVNELFSPFSYVHPEGPISVDDGVTPWLTVGPYDNRPESGGKRRRSVQMWFYNEMLHDQTIVHKMFRLGVPCPLFLYSIILETCRAWVSFRRPVYHISRLSGQVPFGWHSICMASVAST